MLHVLLNITSLEKILKELQLPWKASQYQQCLNLISHCYFMNDTADFGGAVVTCISNYYANISHSKFKNNFACNKEVALKHGLTVEQQFHYAFIRNYTLAQNKGVIYMAEYSRHLLHSIVSSMFINSSAAENSRVI